METRYRKLGSKYVDWYGRPATKEQYVISHSEIQSQEPLPMPEVDLQEEPEGYPIPSDKLTGTRVPHSAAIEKNGITTISQLPKSIKGLKALNGIGVKSAIDIAYWLEETRGINVAGYPLVHAVSEEE